MRRAVLTSSIALLCAACAGGPKVTSDYDRSADFSRYSTFAWTVPDTVPTNSILWNHFVTAIDIELSRKGLTEADSEPDLYVSAFMGQADETIADTDRYGYDYGPGWYYGGAPAGSRAPARRYTRGTLVVDLWDAATRRLVWRGTGSDIASDDPAVNSEKIGTAVRRMFDRYPPPAAQ